MAVKLQTDSSDAFAGGVAPVETHPRGTGGDVHSCRWPVELLQGDGACGQRVSSVSTGVRRR